MKKIKILIVLAIGIGLVTGSMEISYAKEVQKQNVESLIEALKDEDANTRIRAAVTLGKIKDKRAVEPLIEALKDKYGLIRKRAVFSLGEIKDHRAVEPLIEMLKDKYASIRSDAAYALGKIRDKRAVEPLTEALKDKNRHVRWEIIRALNRMRDARSIEALMEIVKNEKDTEVRAAALTTLGNIKEKPKTIGPLLQVLKNKQENEYIRQEVAWKLGGINDPQAVEALSQILKDENEKLSVRLCTALALWPSKENFVPSSNIVKEPWAIDLLIQGLKDKKFCSNYGGMIVVRLGLLCKSGVIKDPQVKEITGLLIEALKDKNSPLKRDSTWALETITGKNFGKNYNAWMNWWEKNKNK